MSAPPNRLSAEGAHRLKGAEINRSKPLSFRIDGRDIQGFEGDTLLTAAIASGVIGAGLHEGEPLALDERFAPPVLLRGDIENRLRALPMERTPAVNGLDYVTLAQARRHKYRQQVEALRGLLPRRRGRLGVNYDEDASLSGPWFDVVPERELEADLAVIGAGVAGLNAALTAGRRGERVVLIERRQWLGGDARFYGATGDEESADATIGRLAAALVLLGNVTILRHAEAFALFEGSIRVNQVEVAAGIPSSHVLTINSSRIVLANGSIERLPVFAGNRLPGVVGALAAFNRAERFGTWIGKRALLATANSVAYRIAMQAKDAGIGIERIADTRLDPQSRFVEFSKAYGIPSARGLKLRRAAPAGRRGALTVHLDHGFGEIARAADQFVVDQLMVSGGWQPDLTLWHMAGGGSRWQAETGRLEAEGTLTGIVLAGAVAGHRNTAACLRSGQAAVAQLFGRSVPDIDDTQIDPMHETPDDPTPIGAFAPAIESRAYLDGGVSLAVRPAPSRRRRLPLGRFSKQQRWGFADEARPLGVADVAAGVQLGVIPPDDAAIVAQERCVAPGDIVDAGRMKLVVRRETEPAATPPAYLAGRFGPRVSVWVVEATDGRSFDIGCLVQLDADHTDPVKAIGVVFAPAPAGRTGGLAVIGKSPIAAGDQLVVRDISASVPVRLIDPLAPIEKPIVITPVVVGAPAEPPVEAAAPASLPPPAVVATTVTSVRRPEPPAPPLTTESALAMIAGMPPGAQSKPAAVASAAPLEAAATYGSGAMASHGTATDGSATGPKPVGGGDTQHGEPTGRPAEPQPAEPSA